ncbi:MAG: hypothetical protein BWY85_00104 [Firmicutes bacterium ADurb.Bin506]|nr:MAG: hypothetical protein BWY85_00104 [Firmicutes bacterium ADurb.Bin506]
MTITHYTTTRDAMCNAVVGGIDLGTTLPNGRLQLSVNSGFTDIIVSIDLQNPAFAVSSGGAGSAAMNCPPEGLSAVYAGPDTKTANYFRFVNREGTEIFRGTVSSPTGQGDMRLADNVIPPGTTVIVTAFAYQTIP